MPMIDSFMIKLGFEVDKDQEAKFNGATSTAGSRVATMGKVAAGAMVAVGAAVLKASSEMSKLSIQAHRSGTSAGKLKGLGIAFERLGGNASQAVGAVEGLRTRLRDLPGTAQAIKKVLNVDVFDKTTGKMKDQVEILMEMGKQFQKMSSAQATLAGQQFGLDPQTVELLRSGELLGQYQTIMEEQRMISQNFDKNAESAQQFMDDVSSIWDNFKLFAMNSLTTLVGDQLHEIRKEFPKVLGGVTAVFEQMKKDSKEKGWWEALKGAFFGGGETYTKRTNEIEAERLAKKNGTTKEQELRKIEAEQAKEKQAKEQNRKYVPNDGYDAYDAKTAEGKLAQRRMNTDQNGSVEDTGDSTIDWSDAYSKDSKKSPEQIQKQYEQNSRDQFKGTGQVIQGNEEAKNQAQGKDAKVDKKSVDALSTPQPVQAVTTPMGETRVSNVTNNVKHVNSDSHNRNVTINQNITVNGTTGNVATDTGKAVRKATQSSLSMIGNGTD